MVNQTRFVPLVIVLLVGSAFWLLPTPEAVTPQGFHLLGIFVATIVGIILKVLPMGAVALMGLSATILTGSLTFEEAFSGFQSSVVWLIVAAFFIARGFTKTGLGSRIAYFFVRSVGQSTLGLGYGLLASELVLSPAIPSNTARTGGVVFPILTSLARSFGSDPALGTAHRMGSFLTAVVFQTTLITSGMFLTAMAANPLIASFAEESGVVLTWGSWALAASVPCLVSLILMPLLVYKIYPPEIKKTPDAKSFAQEKLAEMGRVSPAEWLMIGVFALLLVLWIFGAPLGLKPAASALLGLVLLLLTGVLSWKEVTHEHTAWETLLWFASLIAMATYLSKFGVIEWAGGYIGKAAGGLSWPYALIVLALAYFYIHYFFASVLAHVVALYPVFLAVAIQVGAPPSLAALLFGFLSSLCGGLTHYGSGPAAVLFGSHYVPIGAWWRIGAIVSVLNLLVFGIVGGAWWKLVGLW
jgi:divalent anion:Na+ symporter, DASS family